MITQTKDDMLKAGATETEAREAMIMFKMLRPCLRVNKTGRVNTLWGSKTPLGLYRTIVNLCN